MSDFLVVLIHFKQVSPGFSTQKLYQAKTWAYQSQITCIQQSDRLLQGRSSQLISGRTFPASRTALPHLLFRLFIIHYDCQSACRSLFMNFWTDSRRIISMITRGIKLKIRSWEFQQKSIFVKLFLIMLEFIFTMIFGLYCLQMGLNVIWGDEST